MNSSSLKFALLARVSTESQGERGESLPAQEEFLRTCVRALNATVALVYKGQQHATPGYEQHLLDALLRDALTGVFNAVMVADPTRWSRDNRKSKEAIAVLRQQKIRFFCGTHEYDLKDAHARLILGVHGEIGEFHASTKADSSVKAKIHRAKRGWLTRGTGVYGRRVTNPTDRRSPTGIAEWEVIPEAKRQIEQWYKQYVEQGLTFEKIAAGTTIPSETIRRRLLFGVGSTVVQRFHLEGALVEEVLTTIPPILTEFQIAAVRTRAKENQIYRTIYFCHPLAHIVKCAHCGSVMSAQGDKRKKGRTIRSYNHKPGRQKECTPYIRAVDLEIAIFSQLGQMLRESNSLNTAIRSALVKANGKEVELRQDLNEIERQIRKLEREQANILDQISNISFASESPMQRQIGLRIQKNDQELSILRSRQEALKNELRVVSIPDDIEQRVNAALSPLIGRLGFAPLTWPLEAQKELAKFFFGTTTKKSRDNNVINLYSVPEGVRSSSRHEICPA